MTDPDPRPPARHRAPEVSVSASGAFDPARVARWRQQAAETRSALRRPDAARPRGA